LPPRKCIARGSESNVDRAEKLIRWRQAKGAQIILFRNCLETPFFGMKFTALSLNLATRQKKTRGFLTFSRTGRRTQGFVLPFSCLRSWDKCVLTPLAMD